MTLKQVLLICLTHVMWQTCGAISVLYPQHNFYILRLFMGLVTYLTYRSLLKGN